MCFINRIKGQSAPLFQTACALDGIGGAGCLPGRPVMRCERFPWVWAVIAVPAFAMTIEIASAHDKGCDSNPVPVAIKLDCCSQADEHRLKPEQITRGPNDEYIVSYQAYTFVIPADKALPSNDHCSHIFFENVWVTTSGNQIRFPGTPGVYCFLTPMDF